MSVEKIDSLRRQMFELGRELRELQKAAAATPVPDYTFSTLEGDVTLRQLFSGHDKLLAIHNMGQGCRYCTLWADGLNGFLPHLESAMGVVLLSKDDPATQRKFANSRGWRFRLASHGGGDYISEQSVLAGENNMPGVVAYQLRDGNVLRKNSAVFGPGDAFCSLWNFIGLHGLDETSFTPQFDYWRRPASLDDGGANLLE